MSTITTTYLGDMRFSAMIRGSELPIDVAADFGGTGEAPTPPELFIASIGSCAAAYVAAYCGHHGLDATGLTVGVDYAKAAGPPRLDDIAVTVRLPNAEAGERREGILEAAQRCLIHQTLAHAPQVAFNLLDRAALTTA